MGQQAYRLAIPHDNYIRITNNGPSNLSGRYSTVKISYLPTMGQLALWLAIQLQVGHQILTIGQLYFRFSIR